MNAVVMERYLGLLLRVRVMMRESLKAIEKQFDE